MCTVCYASCRLIVIENILLGWLCSGSQSKYTNLLLKMFQRALVLFLHKIMFPLYCASHNIMQDDQYYVCVALVSPIIPLKQF